MPTLTHIQPFFDPKTWTVSYVVSDIATSNAAVIDPVPDYNFKSGHTDTKAADALLAYVQSEKLTVQWILETHAHADHLSGARYLQERAGEKIAIGEHICEVQATFKKLDNLEQSFLPDGSQFDHLFKHGEVFKIGDVEATALRVLGHRPAEMAYLADGGIFVGDTLFMPDVGTARADFPRGDAQGTRSGAGSPNTHPAIHSGQCPRGAATASRRKRSCVLAHSAKRFAGAEVA